MAAKKPEAETLFQRAMACCGPFEPRPLLAVAVSGGADSMALALLAGAWARRRKGRAVALTVDHGLRPEARDEARQVQRWMKAHGIAHRILPWRGPKPSTGVQAAAREARYRLLTAACRTLGAVHLLIGHTRTDQAETVLLRLASGSGPHGLAAMPLIHETVSLRILRPMLDIPRDLAEAFLRRRRQSWIEDPSNRDDRFARIRVRRVLAAARDADIRAASIAEAAQELGRFRAEQERKIAAALARAIEIFPQGYARVDVALLAGVPPEIGWRALGSLLATIGGLAFVPRGNAVRSLYSDLCAGRLGRGRSLGHCRLMPAGEALLVVRENRGLSPIPAGPGAHRKVEWDGRFEIELRASRRLEISGLGASGWAEIVARMPSLRASNVPYHARIVLPSLRDSRGIVEVPVLGYQRHPKRKKAAFAAFRPKRPLAAAFFAAASPLEPRQAPVV